MTTNFSNNPFFNLSLILNNSFQLHNKTDTIITLNNAHYTCMINNMPTPIMTPRASPDAKSVVIMIGELMNKLLPRR